MSALKSRRVVTLNLYLCLQLASSLVLVTGQSGPVTECQQSRSEVRGVNKVCVNQIIFEDNFDTLNTDIWQVEQYIPIHSLEHPFVSYQRPSVSVSDGYLHITPRLQQDMHRYNEDSIYNGTLHLFETCTASAEECVKHSSGADILPPIVSGKLTSKAFAFKYGEVHIRAQLPRGDWLYPEILLEPYVKKFGSDHYASGLIRIASARGNSYLSDGVTKYSNEVLYGGAIMDLQCRDYFLSTKVLNDGSRWTDNFHDFVVKWSPEEIILLVDGKEWASISPPAGRANSSPSTLSARFPSHCTEIPRQLLRMSPGLAPFNQFFYLSLGVAAGGITEFPDGVRTENNHPKPWTNQGRKALLNFWRDKDAWYETWRGPSLIVDYVKIVALNSTW